MNATTTQQSRNTRAAGLKLAKWLLAIFVTSIVLPLQANAQKTLTVINQRDAFPIWKV